MDIFRKDPLGFGRDGSLLAGKCFPSNGSWNNPKNAVAFLDKHNLWPDTASNLVVQILTYLKQSAPFCQAETPRRGVSAIYSSLAQILRLSRKIKTKCIFRNKGFTLIEVVVALAILSGVIVTVITTLNYHIHVAYTTKSITTATILAKEKIEDINMNGLPSVNEGNFAPSFSDFRWSLRSEDIALSGVKKIYLTVTWGKGEKITIKTYKFVK